PELTRARPDGTGPFMHIGLIGGIGVAATLVYYERLTSAILARGHVPELTIVHADAATLLANNTADNRTAQTDIYCRLIARLAAAGAECAAITSLGGHFCFAETKAVSPLPLVSGIAPLDQVFADKGITRVGLLGTESAMRTRLYGQMHTHAIAPADPGAVGTAYGAMAVHGRASEQDVDFILAAGQALIDAGAEAVLLAGTDLGLVFDRVDPPYPVIDALDAHVAHLADLATGAVQLTSRAGSDSVAPC
ncbi:MAG: aspartate/glutamate racemase family protein, partial [Pseudomonadota bacterium]